MQKLLAPVLTTLLTISGCGGLENKCEYAESGEEVPVSSLHEQTDEALAFDSQSEGLLEGYANITLLLLTYQDNPRATLEILDHSKNNLPPQRDYKTIAGLAYFFALGETTPETQCYLKRICDSIDNQNSREDCNDGSLISFGTIPKD